MPLIKSFKNKSKLILIGSVTLNNYVGGLNPDAIYASAKISDYPIVVWFPTINSENFLKRSKYEIPPEWLQKYLDTRDSLDKAGAYGIQGMANLFIEKINGSYSNVCGMPLAELCFGLRSFLDLQEESPLESYFRIVGP